MKNFSYRNGKSRIYDGFLFPLSTSGQVSETRDTSHYMFLTVQPRYHDPEIARERFINARKKLQIFYSGTYALICGRQIVDVFKRKVDAIQIGNARFKDIGFAVAKIPSSRKSKVFFLSFPAS